MPEPKYCSLSQNGCIHHSLVFISFTPGSWWPFLNILEQRCHKLLWLADALTLVGWFCLFQCQLDPVVTGREQYIASFCEGHLCSTLLGKPWNLCQIKHEILSQREERSRGTGWFSRIITFKLKNPCTGFIPCIRRQAKVAEDLHEWMRGFWQNSDIKNEICKCWRQSLVTWEEHGDSSSTQAWGQESQSPPRDESVQGNKKSFYSYVSTKRKTWGNCSAAKWEQDLVTMGTEKAEVLSTTFVTFFINKIYL